MTRTLSTTGTQFVAKLKINKLKTSDSGDIHHLMVVNQYGNTTYDVQIQHIKSKIHFQAFNFLIMNSKREASMVVK